MSLQPMHAFKPDKALVLRGIINKQNDLKWSQLRVWVGSCGPKRCVTSASPEHSSAAELSMPKPTQEMQNKFTHVQAHQVWILGLCTGNSVRCYTVTSVYSKISFHPPHQLFLQGHHQNQKRSSYSMVCPGQETVHWLQSCARNGLIGHICLRKGRLSGGDDLEI